LPLLDPFLLFIKVFKNLQRIYLKKNRGTVAHQGKPDF